MRLVGNWMGGTLCLGLLAAGSGGCGESSSNNDDEASDGGGSSGGSDGSGTGGGATNGGGPDGTTDSNTGDETASSTDGNTTGATTLPGDPVPFADYAAGVSDILCGWLTPCCTGLGLPLMETGCSETLEMGLGEEYSAADPDNYTYDPEAAGDCLATAREFYDQVGCELGGEPPTDTSAIEACNSVFQGKLEPGASCASDIECARALDEDAECQELDSGSEATVCVVERRASVGESCYWTCTGDSSSYSCSGLGAAETPAVQGRCFTNDQLYCADGVCEEQATLGEPCTEDATCAQGYCSAAGECTAGSADGADCTSTSQCSGGLYCASQTCSPRKALGESCDFSDECQSDYCADYECAEGADAEALAFVCAILASQP